ncbi:hypothetical protein [Alkalihalobacterium alkalinitrilicum]|uniref:hypothetical protein n=1 Tax=Alkalihalobacterium alkalinitrilicum TaxID=427920 RepID=UPI000995BCD3|nr:hypothetical protein [Alkalihalobacterium alkalinitrilicum]
MGGHGSGRYAAGLEKGKETVEQYTHFNINFLAPFLKKGKKLHLKAEMKSNPISKLIVDPNEMYIELEYKKDQEVIYLDKTPCHFGGYRYWFLCQCGKRVGKLYHGQLGFACRSCYDLNYVSQQYAKTDCSYFIWRMYRIANKVDPEFNKQGLNTNFPIFKPKYMHYKTYRKLLHKFELYRFKGERVWIKGCSLIVNRRF